MIDTQTNNTVAMVKILFDPPDDPAEDWHTTLESMFATPIAEPAAPSQTVYRLENSPWYVFGVSFEDLVCAEWRAEKFDGDPETYYVLHFTKVWQHKGHSTYTLFLQGGRTTDSEDWVRYWDRLKTMGCAYEGMNKKLLALDALPGSNLDEIEQVFEQALAEEIFAYQVQHRYSPVPPLEE